MLPLSPSHLCRDVACAMASSSEGVEVMRRAQTKDDASSPRWPFSEGRTCTEGRDNKATDRLSTEVHTLGMVPPLRWQCLYTRRAVVGHGTGSPHGRTFCGNTNGKVSGPLNHGSGSETDPDLHGHFRVTSRHVKPTRRCVSRKLQYKCRYSN